MNTYFQLPQVDIIALQVLIDKLWDTPLGVFRKYPEVWIDYVDQCKLLMERIFHFATYNTSEENAANCRQVKWLKYIIKEFQLLIIKAIKVFC